MSSYYDVDAILTDAQKVPCTFELTVPSLGFLEGNMGGDMKLGEMLALRYKLLETLPKSTDKNSQSLNTSSLVTLDPPAALSPRVLNALKADPKTVDLRALAPHFYNLGARILELFEEEEMIEVLSEVCYTCCQHTVAQTEFSRLSRPELQ
jgi:GINS complex subunit 3